MALTVTPTLLVPVTVITSSALPYYTARSLTRIDKATATNTDSSARTITLYFVAAGSSPIAVNEISQAHSIAAGETWNCPDLVGHLLPAGTSLQAKASVTSVVNLAVSGSVFT